MTSAAMELLVAMLENFANLVSLHMLRAGLERGDCTPNLRKTDTRVVMGRKFAKIDVGGGDYWSGRYMVDLVTMEIFGIKGYGVVHRGYRFGTLSTLGDFDWSEYRAVRRPDAVIEAGWWEATSFTESRKLDELVSAVRESRRLDEGSVN